MVTWGGSTTSFNVGWLFIYLFVYFLAKHLFPWGSLLPHSLLHCNLGNSSKSHLLKKMKGLSRRQSNAGVFQWILLASGSLAVSVQHICMYSYELGACVQPLMMQHYYHSQENLWNQQKKNVSIFLACFFPGGGECMEERKGKGGLVVPGVISEAALLVVANLLAGFKLYLCMWGETPGEGWRCIK